MTCTGTGFAHDVSHPYVARPNGALMCLRCYAYYYGRPVIAPNHGPREVIR